MGFMGELVVLISQTMSHFTCEKQMNHCHDFCDTTQSPSFCWLLLCHDDGFKHKLIEDNRSLDMDLSIS